MGDLFRRQVAVHAIEKDESRGRQQNPGDGEQAILLGGRVLGQSCSGSSPPTRVINSLETDLSERVDELVVAEFLPW